MLRLLSREKIEDVLYFCSIIERLGRETNNRRSDIIQKFSEEEIKHEIQVAWCNSCLSNEQVIAELKTEFNIQPGSYAHNADYLKRFKWHQIGEIFCNYIVCLYENSEKDQEKPLERIIKEVLETPLSELFKNIS